MEEIIIKKRNKVTGIEMLIIMLIVVSILFGLLLDDLEMRLISGALFVIGVFLFFISRSNRKKENDKISYQEDNPIAEASYDSGSISVNKEDHPEEEIKHHDDFVIIKSIPNNKKKNSKVGSEKLSYNENNGDEILSDGIESKDNSAPAYENESEHKGYNISRIFSPESSNSYNISGKDPKSEFGIFLSNILDIVKEVTFAHSVLFFWVDTERELIVFDSAASSSENLSLKKKESLDFSSNLVSRIAKNAKSEIVTNINSDAIKELLGYYNNDEKVKSVIGIPIFFEDNLVAVLVVDSLEEDAYGKETVNQLSYFVHLLSNLIKSSTEKYEYFSDSKILQKIDRINDLALSGVDLDSFIKEAAHNISDLVEWDYSALILNDGNEWVIKEVIKKDPLKAYVSLKLKVDLDNSLVGNVIRENKFTIVEDVAELNLPRFAHNEKIINAGSMLIMPVYAFSKTYGALVFESCRKNAYVSEDANLLNKVCKSIASIIEIVFLNNYIDERLTFDQVTGTLKNEYFLQKITAELDRQRDFSGSGIFILTSIDKYDELSYKYGVSGYNTIINSLVEIISSVIPAYDMIGRIDENILGIFRYGLNLDDGKVFAEKIRKMAAGNIISIDSKSFSVTISVGLVDTKKYTTSLEVFENCKKALSISAEEGGNRVKIN